LDSAYPLVRKAFSLQALTTLGLASYSIYLWQQPFYKASHDDPAWALPLAGAGIAVGVLSYRLVEKPSRAWLNRAWPHVHARWRTVAAMSRRTV
jgi:peptidoglycan/LPS O-acetylase OafA/YrhL